MTDDEHPSEPADRENGVKAALTPKRAGRVVETSEFAAFARRIVRAYGRRISSGDVDALPELLAMATEIDAVIVQSVAGLRAEGYSWGEIGARLGTTRQAAQQRFGRPTTPTGETADTTASNESRGAQS